MRFLLHHLVLRLHPHLLVLPLHRPKMLAAKDKEEVEGEETNQKPKNGKGGIASPSTRAPRRGRILRWDGVGGGFD
jgi:hypothetical protein